MGATVFSTVTSGPTAKAAFDAARASALYQEGHGGYTGTIAEKRSFVMIECPKDTDVNDFINKLIDSRDSRIDDKWGPAGCIQVEPQKFVFFGWAST